MQLPKQLKILNFKLTKKICCEPHQFFTLAGKKETLFLSQQLKLSEARAVGCH
jgi:hypothetical protein